MPLQHYADRPLRIGSFSAASNVTGIITNTHAVSILLHRDGYQPLKRDVTIVAGNTLALDFAMIAVMKVPAPQPAEPAPAAPEPAPAPAPEAHAPTTESAGQP